MQPGLRRSAPTVPRPEDRIRRTLSGVGALFWQMDRRFRKFAPTARHKLPHLASGYLRRQVFRTFEIDPIGPRVTRFFGEDNYMWASDYPHSPTTWPMSREVIADIFSDVPEAIKNRIAGQNCANLFRMDLG